MKNKIEILKKKIIDFIETKRLPMELGNTDNSTSRINAHLYEIIEFIRSLK